MIVSAKPNQIAGVCVCELVPPFGARAEFAIHDNGVEHEHVVAREHADERDTVTYCMNI